MKGEYWFNSEPISKHIDIIFEYEEYQFINNVVHLLSIEELKKIINSFKEVIPVNEPYSFAKEYIYIRIDFGLCTIEYRLPNQPYKCHIRGYTLVKMLERYVYKYEHFEDRFKNL